VETRRYGDTETHVPVSPPMPWVQVLLISCGPLVAFAAMVNFAPILPIVREELGISNSWAGILASATLLSHTILQLPGGQLTDHIGGKRALSMAVTLVGAGLIASGLAPSFELLLLARFILGAGTGLTFIAGIAFIHSVVPPDRRVIGQGIFGGAGNLGVLLVLLFSERLAGAVTWRGAFLVEGIVALGIAVLLWTRLRSGESHAEKLQTSWGETLRQYPLYLLGLAHILTYGVYVAVSSWAATFLYQTYGVGLEWAGPLAAILSVSAVAGRGIGGAISVNRERPVILVTCFGSVLFTALFPLMPGIVPSLVALLILGFFAAVPFGAVFSYITRISDKGTSGRGLSVINFVGNLGAFAFPPIIGYALDVTGSFAVGFGLLAALGLAIGLLVAAKLPRASTPSVQPD
jgi:nitrate/nitrite transporter NarK